LKQNINPDPGFETNPVLEKNPPKQGLKQTNCFKIQSLHWVLEKNPPKQGLKQTDEDWDNLRDQRFREKSTKTRIETASRKN